VRNPPTLYAFTSLEYQRSDDRIEAIERLWTSNDQELREGLDVEEAVTKRVWWIKDAQYLLQSSGGKKARLLVNKAVDPQQLEWQRAGRHAGSALEGYVRGDMRSLARVLGEARDIRIERHRERLGDAVCTVIRASSPDGDYEVWFDIQRGYNVLRASVTKEKHHRYFEKTVGEMSLRPLVVEPEEVGEVEPTSFKRFNVTLDNVVLKQVEGVWVPMSATVHELIELSDGQVAHSEHRVKRTAMSFTADFGRWDTAVLPIPDGTEVVLVGGSPAIRLQWKRGEIVPLVDEENVKRLDDETSQHRQR
jgi:hypothetical protein